MAKKKKTKTGTVVDANISSQSRYTSPPVTLRIGPDHQPYYVPEILLQSLHDLPFSESLERTIDLPDVDAETGHVIVHFLYTNQYQTLPDIEEESGPNYSRADFKKAISAFIAAMNYKLTALQELARSEVSKCGENIGITQVAHGVGKDTLCALQEDAAWLQDLVLRKADQAFENNDVIFSSTSFFSGIKSHKLAKLLGQHVAKLYHSLFEDISRETSRFKASLPNQEVLPTNEYGSMEKFDASSSVTPSNEVYADKQSTHLPPEIETPVDDWSFGLSKKQRKQKPAHVVEEGWGTSWSTVPQAEPEPVVETATESAVNTVLIEDASLVTPNPIKETAEFTVDQADAEDSWAFPGMGAGTKKKKKKKKTTMVAYEEEPLAIESEILNTVENLPATNPASAERSSTDSTHGRIPEAPAEMVKDSVLDPTAIIKDSPVIAEHPMTNEQPDQWGVWGASLGSSKKKKKKMKKDKAARIEASSPPPPLPPPLSADTSIVVNEDLIEPEHPSEPALESAPEPEEVPEEVPEVNESKSRAIKAAYDGTVSVDMESPNDDRCMSRYEHLIHEEHWKECQQCKSYVHKIAMKVQHEKHMSVNFQP